MMMIMKVRKLRSVAFAAPLVYNYLRMSLLGSQDASLTEIFSECLVCARVCVAIFFWSSFLGFVSPRVPVDFGIKQNDPHESSC